MRWAGETAVVLGLSIRIRITRSRFLPGSPACLLRHMCTYCARARASVGVELSVTLHRVAGWFWLPMTGLIFHVNEWKGLCYDRPDALSIFAPQMEQRWHFITICRPPGSPSKHSGCTLGLWRHGCLRRVAAERMFPLRCWGKRLIDANAEEEWSHSCKYNLLIRLKSL